MDYINNMKGHIIVKAHYWSLDNDGELIEDKHSIQITQSINKRITNNTYKDMIGACLRKGSFLHFHELGYRNPSERLWTYKIMSIETVYLRNPKIYYNKRKGIVKSVVKGRKPLYYEMHKPKKNILRDYSKKLFVTLDRSKNEHSIAYEARQQKELSMIQRRESIARRRDYELSKKIRQKHEPKPKHKKRYLAKAPRKTIAPSVDRLRRKKDIR